MPHSALAGLGTRLGAGGKSAAGGEASVSAGGEAVGRGRVLAGGGASARAPWGPGGAASGSCQCPLASASAAATRRSHSIRQVPFPPGATSVFPGTRRTPGGLSPRPAAG